MRARLRAASREKCVRPTDRSTDRPIDRSIDRPRRAADVARRRAARIFERKRANREFHECFTRGIAMWDRSDNRTSRPTVFPARIWRRAFRAPPDSSSCASKTIALRRDAVFVRGSRGSVRARVGERSRARVGGRCVCTDRRRSWCGGYS